MSNGLKKKVRDRNITDRRTGDAVRLLAGPHAKVRVWQNKRDVQRCIISCHACGNRRSEGGGQRAGFTSQSDGTDHGPGSTVKFALDCWEQHLWKVHGERCAWSDKQERAVAYAAWRKEGDELMGIPVKHISTGPRPH